MLRQAEHDVARERPKWHDYRKNHPSYYPGTRVNEYTGVTMLRFTIRAALLDGSIYEELRERRETTFHALLSVLIGAAGFGLGVWSAQSGMEAATDRNYSLFVAISTTFTGWFLWALFVWLLAKLLFGIEAGFRATVRCIGVCYAPLAIWLLLDVPILGSVALVTGLGWPLVAATVAVKHGLDIDWWKAVVATAVGWFWGLFILPLWFVFFPLAGTQ